MKTKFSTRLVAWFVVSIMLISAILVIPVSGEWTLPEWVNPYNPDDPVWNDYWSWEEEGTGMPSPDDPNDGLPYDWNIYHWETYGARYDMSLLSFEDKSSTVTTAKAGDVVWLRVSVEDVDTEMYPDGIYLSTYAITFDDSKALPFMMPTVPVNTQGNSFDGMLDSGETWFRLCFQPNVKTVIEWESSFYLARYHDNDYFDSYMLGLHIGTQTRKSLTSGQAVWYFPMQLDESLVDGDVVTFTIPYPQQNVTVVGNPSAPHNQAAKGGSVSVTIKNHEDVEDNIASGSSYAVSNDGSDLSDKTTGFVTDGKRPLTNSANYDIVDGNLYGQVDFRGPADVNSVTFTFNTNDSAAVPTEVVAYGITASGDKVSLGSASNGTAVFEGIVNNDTVNPMLDGYELSEFTGWEEAEIDVVNDANAYKFTIDGFEAASYVGLYFEATAATDKSIAVGEIEVNGAYSKFDVTVIGGTIADASSEGYVPGTELTITADVPADYEFTGWTLSEGADGTIADDSAISTTFTVGATDAVITANYTAKKYTLTVIDGTGSGDYAKNDTVAITADAEIEIEGIPYVFSNWALVEGDATITDDTACETTVVTNGVATIKAEYVIATYNLNVIDGTGSGTYEYGELVEIVADEKEDKIFVSWEIVSDSSNGDSYLGDSELSSTTIVVYGAVTVRPVYVDKTYALTVVNGTGDGNYKKNETVDIVADTPANGMMFDKWVVVSGNATFSDDSSATTTVTTSNEDTVIEATYRSKYNLVVENGNGDGQYGVGEKATIVADAPQSDRFAFFYWNVEDEATVSFEDGYSMFDEEAVITISADAKVTAVYQDLYVDANDNLALYSDITLNKGTTTFELGLIQDKLYPAVEKAVWPTFQSVDGKVQMTYTLPGCYNVDMVVLNSGWLANDNKAYFPNGVRVYGANKADGSDALLLIEDLTLCNDPENRWDTWVETADQPSRVINSYLYTLNIPEENRGNFNYIIIEYDCTFSDRFGNTNEKLMLGEVEIYGEEANFIVDVVNGSIVDIISGSSVEREDGWIGYTSGTVLQLKPDDNTDLSEFDYWYGCSNGVIDEENNTFTVGTGDATIIAKFTDIHKPVPDNLVPGATMMLTQGTLVSGSIGTEANGWFDGGYLADQLYPLTYGARWTVIQREDNAVKMVFDLGDQYDVNEVAFTFAYGPEDSVERPSSIQVYGANNADYSDKTSIVSLSNAQIDNIYETITLEDGSKLVSVALRKNLVPTNFVTYRYVIIELPCNLNASGRNPFSNEYIKVGEIEIYGADSQFKLDVQNGTIAPEAIGNLYDNGDVVTITANTIPDMQFTGWTVISGDAVIEDPTNPETNVTVGVKDSTIVANYIDILYTLTVVNGSGTGDYIRGTTVNLVAETPADPELVFDKWIITEGNVIVNEGDLLNPAITVRTDGTATITATYKNRIYGLTVEQGSGDGDYANGTVVTIVADEPAADKRFDKWIIVTGDGTFADATSATTTFTTTNEPTTIRATYVDIPYNVTVENGAIADEDIDSDGYVVGTVIDITADEIADKEFIGWVIVSGNGTFGDAQSETTTFTTGSGDTVIKAEYKDILYNVTVNNGAVSADDVSEDGYVVGTEITIVADEAPIGQKFVGWIITSGNATLADPEAATTELTVGSGGVVIEAVYEKIAYNVTVENGIVGGEIKEEYYYGDVVTIIADAPVDGMLFAGWTLVSGENANISGNTVEATVTVGTSDVVVRAEYAVELFQIEIDGGYIAKDDISEIGYPEGAIVDIIADDADIGYVFGEWIVVEGDAIIADATNPNTTLTVGSSNAHIEAVYVKEKYELTIIDGDAEGGVSDFYYYGDKVVIIADEIAGKEFIGWTIVNGAGASIDDAKSDAATLTFGADDVVVRADYKTVTDTPATGDRGFALYILLALVTICGATMLIYKKKAVK